MPLDKINLSAQSTQEKAKSLLTSLVGLTAISALTLSTMMPAMAKEVKADLTPAKTETLAQNAKSDLPEPKTLIDLILTKSKVNVLPDGQGGTIRYSSFITPEGKIIVFGDETDLLPVLNRIEDGGKAMPRELDGNLANRMSNASDATWKSVDQLFNTRGIYLRDGARGLKFWALEAKEAPTISNIAK